MTGPGALADLMDHLANDTDERVLRRDLTELRDAVGLEEHQSTSHNDQAIAGVGR